MLIYKIARALYKDEKYDVQIITINEMKNYIFYKLELDFYDSVDLHFEVDKDKTLKQNMDEINQIHAILMGED